MPGYVAKRSDFVNTFFSKRSKKISLHACSKAVDEQLKNQVLQATSLAACD
jgi:hypothetical protein